MPKSRLMGEIIKIRAVGGVAVVNSRDVAVDSGKRHADVLRDIDGFLTDADLRSLNWFRRVDYIDEKGEARKSYDMTRQGWEMLALGWTGDKWTKLRAQYIEAFHAMEERLRSTIGLTPDLARRLDNIERKQDETHRLQAEQHRMTTELHERFARDKKPIPKASRDAARRTLHLGFNGICLLTHKRLLDERGEIIEDEQGPIAEYDHARRPHQVGPEHIWLIERQYNRDLGSGARSRDMKVEGAFLIFQERRESLAPPPAPLPQFTLFETAEPQTSAPRGKLTIAPAQLEPEPIAPEPEPDLGEPEPAEPALDLGGLVQPGRGSQVAQILRYECEDMIGTLEQITVRYQIKHPDAGGSSVRDALNRQNAESKVHRDRWATKYPAIFRHADGSVKGERGVRYMLTEAGIELAERIGPRKLP